MRRCSLLVLIALLCAFTSAPVMAHDHDPPRIMPAGVMEKMSSGAEVVFLDTRTESARASGPAGISGSVHIHNNEALRKFIENTPKDSFIVTYCTWPNEQSSASLARALLKAGLKNVYPLEGGLKAWLDAGYPTAKK